MYKESKTLELNHRHYCVYCGKEAKADDEWCEWDHIYHYYCDCKDATNEIKINDEIKKLHHECKIEQEKIVQPYNIRIYELKKQYPKENFSVQTKILRIDEQNSKN